MPITKSGSWLRPAAAAATGLAPARERREERAHDARERDRPEELLALGAWQEVEEQHERAGPEHEQRGQEGPQQDRGRDEIDHWSGGREAGAVGGWPETRRDPAAFRMPLFIPSGSASPARPWVDRERCAGRSPSPAPER